jgi:hypothetical protein
MMAVRPTELLSFFIFKILPMYMYIMEIWEQTSLSLVCRTASGSEPSRYQSHQWAAPTRAVQETVHVKLEYRNLKGFSCTVDI